MNTPAHLALSIFIWRGENKWLTTTAVAFGALLPDLPMVGFYLYQRLWLSTPEQLIWEERYFESSWQLFFDLFNSFPIMLTLALACWVLMRRCQTADTSQYFRIGFLISASALVHLLFDFPLHHDDAHRHFLPISNWRFESPLSYWDPSHFGQFIMRIELALALLACIFVAWRGPGKPMRITAGLTMLSYVAFLLFVLTQWSSL